MDWEIGTQASSPLIEVLNFWFQINTFYTPGELGSSDWIAVDNRPVRCLGASGTWIFAQTRYVPSRFAVRLMYTQYIPVLARALHIWNRIPEALKLLLEICYIDVCSGALGGGGGKARAGNEPQVANRSAISFTLEVKKSGHPFSILRSANCIKNGFEVLHERRVLHFNL